MHARGREATGRGVLRPLLSLLGRAPAGFMPPGVRDMTREHTMREVRNAMDGPDTWVYQILLQQRPAKEGPAG